MRHFFKLISCIIFRKQSLRQWTGLLSRYECMNELAAPRRATVEIRTSNKLEIWAGMCLGDECPKVQIRARARCILSAAPPLEAPQRSAPAAKGLFIGTLRGTRGEERENSSRRGRGLEGPGRAKGSRQEVRRVGRAKAKGALTKRLADYQMRR